MGVYPTSDVYSWCETSTDGGFMTIWWKNQAVKLHALALALAGAGTVDTES